MGQRLKVQVSSNGQAQEVNELYIGHFKSSRLDDSYNVQSKL